MIHRNDTQKKCKHAWEIIVNEYEKSQFQKHDELKGVIEVKNMCQEFFIGRKIIILQCKKCGKLDKTVERV